MPQAVRPTPELLADLRRPRPYPAVSVTLLTHRHRPENQQDHIRLRQLLDEAGKRLADDPEVPRDTRLAVAGHLQKAGEELDPETFLDGLVLYASADEHRAYRVGAEVPDRIVLGTTYLTRNLVAAEARQRPYWVLVLGEDEVRLWHGRGSQVAEASDAGFPVRSPAEDRDGPITREGGGLGVSQDVRSMFQQADDLLAAALAGRAEPVVLVGLRPQIAFFRSVTRHTEHIGAELDKGGMQHTTPAEFAAELAPARAQLTATRGAAALAELDAARSGRRYAGGVQDVWMPAHEGRVAHLVVEEGLRITARPQSAEGIDRASLDIVDGNGSAPRDGVEDDIVDSLVEAVLDADGAVDFVPDGTLADAGGIAAALRY
ncbi:baeRF3 domain-containing protein [Yinghuangia soli]|uniref:Chemotaxis protein n=1 Tax=Yinghuangia soli TaxID=2908204 RepID=A0AA41Q5Q5_9ACTN|nr:chemotaxis protein [Yinghuangia soli]MCF2532060.1 chemotaxis protein [Yinghuangia soli]